MAVSQFLNKFTVSSDSCMSAKEVLTEPESESESNGESGVIV